MSHWISRRALALLFLLAATSAFLPTVAQARPSTAAGCGANPYTYAGLQSKTGGYGIAATLSALAIPAVSSGHVAGWVGVGGPGMGPNGEDEWIQAGLNTTPANGIGLYYEIARPGRPVEFQQIATDLRAGEKHRIAVLEMAQQPGWWRVWVDGQPVTNPVFLPGSDGGWPGVATAENWNGGNGSCNTYSYLFEKVAVAGAAGGSWQPLISSFTTQDPGYRVVRRNATSFVATTSV